ncbi:hypothetical protein QQG55_7410 [Brugia pahangi]
MHYLRMMRNCCLQKNFQILLKCLNNKMSFLMNSLFTIIFVSFTADCKELLCYSCNSQFGSCDGNGCSTTSNSFCVYQQIISANGNIVRTIRSCLDMNVVTVGQIHTGQIGQCIETIDPNTNMKYRTYLCNSHNYCNVDCDSQRSTFTVNPVTPTRRDVLECFKCNNFGTDCYSNTCMTNHGGYCFFQMLNVSMNNVRTLHYNKQCIDIPFAKTPDGNSVTEINKCVISTDMLGNHFYTLICNEANLCNANCNWIPAVSTAPVVPVVSMTSTEKEQR